MKALAWFIIIGIVLVCIVGQVRLNGGGQHAFRGFYGRGTV